MTELADCINACWERYEDLQRDATWISFWCMRFHAAGLVAWYALQHQIYPEDRNLAALTLFGMMCAEKL